jgi:uncharacterized membrane protein
MNRLPDAPLVMLGRLQSLWQRLGDSLWFLPALLVCGAIVLAFAMVHGSTLLDREAVARLPRLFGAGAEGSRSMLSMIAGSMVTVAGVTFSILVVAVSQASTQYTPRVMRNFMRDRLSQVTLGVLIGVFVYCLIVLRTVRGGDKEFVPGLAVLLAIVLALLAVALLMYFIHHIASTLEAGRILDSIARETVTSVDRYFPEAPIDSPARSTSASGKGPADVAWTPIPAQRTGYIQHLDVEGLVETAARCDWVIRMDRAVGEFVVEGTPVASLAGGAPTKDLRSVNDHYVIATYRTVYQDPGFGIRQIVDIALKALSPGVNDSTTAVACVDYLTSVIVRMARRWDPPTEHFVDGRLRVIVRGATFDALLDEALSEIRRNSADNIRVLIRSAAALELIAVETRSTGRHAALLRQLDSLQDTVARAKALGSERDEALQACDKVRGLLSRSGA